MGSQQILLILFTVFIIGISISIGSQLVTQYDKMSVQQGAILDMKNIAQNVIEWWKTTENQGGGNHKELVTDADLPAIKSYINYEQNDAGNFITLNGEFEIFISGELAITIEAMTTYEDVSPVLTVSLVHNIQELQ